MTPLKWIVSEAKKLKKQYPKRFAKWTDYVAQASAIYASKHKGKSPIGKKKVGAVKKKAAKKSVKLHKDTKSHNVNIKVGGYEGTSKKGKYTNVHYTNSRIKGIKTPSAYIKTIGKLSTNYPIQREIVVGKIGKISSVKTIENLIPNVKVKITRGRKFYKEPVITSIDTAAEVLKKYVSQSKLGTQEHAAIMYLDRQNRVIGVYLHTTGGITSTIIDVRLILAAALKLGATGLILSHNHPSGNLTPSQADIQMTNELIKAAKYHDISIVDHIILTPNNYRSMRENNDVKFS